MTINQERAIGLTAKMYDTRRFLKEHSSADHYDSVTEECRKMISAEMARSGTTSELDAALEIAKFARDRGATDQIGWVVAAAVDMLEGAR